MRRSLTALLAVPALLVAGGQGALAGTMHRSTKPATDATTTTTVMGGGKPSTWPAAKPYPPSLAGAYSPNMKTAFLTLVRYSDWVGTHPNPKLVKNYASPASDIYAAQVYLMSQMAKRGWHLPPTPSQIDFLVVAKKPKLRRKVNGKALTINGKSAYTPGTIDVVVQQVTEPYINREGAVVGHTARGSGPEAWRITLVQNDRAQFVMDGYYGIRLHGTLQQWEREVAKKY